MFIRVIQFTGARDVEGGLEFIRNTVAPLLHQQKGFRGTSVTFGEQSVREIAFIGLG